MVVSELMKVVKLNLGAGPTGLNGWINYDWGLLPLMAKLKVMRDLLVKIGWLGKEYQVEWPEFELHDIRRTFPLDDDSVDYIYCSHVLEHFEKSEAARILKDCLRVLKNTGVIRIVVPDLKKMVELYGRNSDADKFSKLVWGFDDGNLQKSKLDNIRRLFIREHKWAYDIKSMADLLKLVGFKDVRVSEHGKSKIPDIEFLDLKEHKQESMYIEASSSQK
jgi:SAM-dependent methyltransferase